MKKLFCLVILLNICLVGTRAQILPTTNLYDTNLMMAHLNAVRQMSERAAQIRATVQPYRERMYQFYREGKYREALEVCYEVRRNYVYYVHDNKAISDMEIIAGDCATRMRAYEAATDWYQTAKQAGETGMDSRLSNVFELAIGDAREAYRNRNYSSLWDNVSLALKTGWESGECYYYYGVCYEQSNNLREAKKMYKLAKKKKYAPAIIALQELKKKR